MLIIIISHYVISYNFYRILQEGLHVPVMLQTNNEECAFCCVVL